MNFIRLPVTSGNPGGRSGMLALQVEQSEATQRLGRVRGSQSLYSVRQHSIPCYYC